MIRIADLTKSYREATVLAIDQLVMTAGTTTALTGPNGAGKSTLLMIIAGLVRPTSGSVQVAQSSPGTVGARKTVSFVPDQPALFDDLTLEDQLYYVSRLYKRNEPTDQCLELIGLLEAEELLPKFPRSMSKGQRQKAALLVGTARPFTVLLLDEPTTALDSRSRHALVEACRRFASLGSAVVSSTHEPELIAAADFEVRLDGGAVVS